MLIIINYLLILYFINYLLILLLFLFFIFNLLQYRDVFLFYKLIKHKNLIIKNKKKNKVFKGLLSVKISLFVKLHIQIYFCNYLLLGFKIHFFYLHMFKGKRL